MCAVHTHAHTYTFIETREFFRFSSNDTIWKKRYTQWAVSSVHRTQTNQHVYAFSVDTKPKTNPMFYIHNNKQCEKKERELKYAKSTRCSSTFAIIQHERQMNKNKNWNGKKMKRVKKRLRQHITCTLHRCTILLNERVIWRWEAKSPCTMCLQLFHVVTHIKSTFAVKCQHCFPNNIL